MPLLDSFCVDHVRMNAPGVRLAKTMKTPKGDDISVFDLRFCKPNEEILPEKGIHTLEHLFAGFMRDHLNGKGVEIIDISPMGCRTGFYMSVIGVPSEEAVKAAWTASMKDILGVKSTNRSLNLAAVCAAFTLATNLLKFQIWLGLPRYYFKFYSFNIQNSLRNKI